MHNRPIDGDRSADCRAFVKVFSSLPSSSPISFPLPKDTSEKDMYAIEKKCVSQPVMVSADDDCRQLREHSRQLRLGSKCRENAHTRTRIRARARVNSIGYIFFSFPHELFLDTHSHSDASTRARAQYGGCRNPLVEGHAHPSPRHSSFA